MANEIKNNLALSYDEMPTLIAARDCLNINRAGFIDYDSVTLPIKRTLISDSDPLPMQDDLDSDDFLAISDRLDEDLNRFSDSAILDFVNKLIADKKSANTDEVSFENNDNFILMILAILKSSMESIPFSIEKLKDMIEHEGYYMPLYEFKRIKEKK